MGRFRAVILDVDGTLVDSNDLHARAWVDAFQEAGREVRFERVRPLIGMGGDNLLPALSGLSPEDRTGKAIAERRSEIFCERYLERVRPFPGTRELLQRMREAGLRLAVASSAREEELAPLLEIAGAADLVRVRTSADDAERSKPDPDIVEAALRRIEVPPSEAVMLGDTPYDIEAASRAGLPAIALRSGGWDDRGLEGALAVYHSPADLLRQFDRSPLA